MNNKYEIAVKPFSRTWFKQWACIVLGTLLMAAGYVLFITPYHIIPGGVYGIAIAINAIFPSWMVGTIGLCLDIPILLLGIKMFGRKFGAKTIIAALLLPAFMNGLTLLIGGTDPAVILNGAMNLSSDMLLACIFGGVFTGVGLALILLSHATSGGTDIIAMIVTKYFKKVPISKAILYVDSLVVIFGLIILQDWKTPLYSLITIFVISNLIDYIMEGGGSDKIVYILTKKQSEMEELIINELDRSATYISARGMYTKDDKDMIFLVIPRREVPTVRDYVKMVDPDAFLIIANAHEIYGEGFTEIKAADSSKTV